MSKAFTKEDDNAVEQPVRPRPSSSLPFGAKNYLTERGSQQMREELNRLLEVERPRLAAAPENSGVNEPLKRLDERVSELQQALGSATIVPPPREADGKVRFGATVTVRKKNGDEEQYRIVGVDETDIDRGWVSWVSPIAKALLNSSVGERVRFKFPTGEEQLEILSVVYESQKTTNEHQ
jgi:transcription elongation factor GreB